MQGESMTGGCTTGEDIMGEDTTADGGMTGKDAMTGKSRTGQDMERVGTGATENIACVQV